MKTALFLITALVLISGCVSQTADGQQEKVKIGGLFALTGYASFAGQASRDGFVMAIEDSGMNISYVIEDFQSGVKTVATAASKLTDVDSVRVVIGPEWLEFGEIAAPISVQKKVLFMSPWMTSETLRGDYYLVATPSERGQIRKTIEYMIEKNITNIVLIYSNNAWSVAVADIFKDELSKKQKTVIEEFRVDEGAKDFRTEIVKIKELSPGAIYAAISNDNDQGLLNRQLKELNIDYKMYVPFSRAESSIFLTDFADVADGIIYSAPREYKNAQAFREKYVERFGKEPSAISAATAYDMTTLVLMAIKNGAKTPEEIRNFVTGVKDYDGYSNIINFDEYGRVKIGSEDYVVKRLSGNKPVEID